MALSRLCVILASLVSLAVPRPLAEAAIPSPACPVTRPPMPPFTPPSPYPAAPETSTFWYGDANLWTMLPTNGTLAPRDKTFWWHPGYDGAADPRPELAVTAKERSRGVTIFSEGSTNAYHESSAASRCWR